MLADAEREALPRNVGVVRGITMDIAKIITAAVCMAVGLWIGSALFLTILAHASEYTGVGRDNTGEVVLVEFDETDKSGNLSGVMWRRLEMVEVDGKWCGKGLARFDDVKVEVVK